MRNQIDDEIKSVLEYVDDFVKNIHKDSNNGWSRKGPATSCAFLLVAKPSSWSVNPYVYRVAEHLNQGVERIYIMGTNIERRFVKNTISAISKLPSCHLVEIFELHRDYRGDRNGIGALYYFVFFTKPPSILPALYADKAGCLQKENELKFRLWRRMLPARRSCQARWKVLNAKF